MTRPRRHPLVAAAYGLVSVSMLGVIFLASITGYLGPSRGPLDPMTLFRFRVIHYGVFPSLAVALSALAYYGLGPRRDAAPIAIPASSLTT